MYKFSIAAALLLVTSAAYAEPPLTAARYAAQLGVGMDVGRSDFLRPSAVRDKLLVALGVLSLALLFAATHLQQIALFLIAALHAR